MNLYKVEVKPKYSKNITYLINAKSTSDAKQAAANRYWASTGDDPEDTKKIAKVTRVK